MRNRTSVTLMFAGALLAAWAAGGCTAVAPGSEPTERASDETFNPPAGHVDTNLDLPGDADTSKFDNGMFLNGGM